MDSIRNIALSPQYMNPPPKGGNSLGVGGSDETLQDSTLLKGEKPPRPWTVLVYSSITPDIDTSGMDAARELEEAGSDEKVAVALQLSRSPVNAEGTWTGARRYYINSASSEAEPAESQDLASPVLEDLGRVDMANPETLEKFIRWGLEKFPAQHTVLVLGGHSGGFLGAITDDKRSHLMPLPEIQKTLQRVEKETGKKLDILVFNSCLMSSMETVTQLDTGANFIVASEQKENGAGMPLGMFIDTLQDLESGGYTPSAREAAEILVKESAATPERTPVVAALETGKASNLTAAVDNLAETLLSSAVPREIIQEIIKNTVSAVPGERIDPPLTDHRDLFDFCRNLAESSRLKDAAVKEQALKVMDTIKQNILVSTRDESCACPEKETGDTTRYHGISIYLPAWDPKEYGEMVNSIITEKYNSLEFAGTTRWMEFLHRLFDGNNT